MAADASAVIRFPVPRDVDFGKALFGPTGPNSPHFCCDFSHRIQYVAALCARPPIYVLVPSVHFAAFRFDPASGGCLVQVLAAMHAAGVLVAILRNLPRRLASLAPALRVPARSHCSFSLSDTSAVAWMHALAYALTCVAALFSAMLRSPPTASPGASGRRLDTSRPPCVKADVFHMRTPVQDILPSCSTWPPLFLYSPYSCLALRLDTCRCRRRGYPTRA
jgi:hypothetical protein